MDTNPAKDEEHLNLLATFHYVLSGLIALFALFPVIHLILGIVFIVAPDSFADDGAAPPKGLGWFFVIFASGFILCGLIVASFVLATGRFLAQQKRRTFCIVVAGIECAFMPFGTVLGVFTIIVLMRDSVTELFNGQQEIESSSVATEFDESF